MPDQITDTTITSEAKVIAETTEGMATNASAEPIRPTESVTRTDEPQKRKKNPIATILAILFGFVALCAVCGIGGFLLLSKAIQNSPQAVTVKDFYTALNDNDTATIKKLTTSTLYEDLYSPSDTGNTLAGVFKGNVKKVSITSVSTKNNTGTVEFTLTVSANQALLGKINYAELQKVGDVWVITYIGPRSDSVPTPTETFEFLPD